MITPYILKYAILLNMAQYIKRQFLVYILALIYKKVSYGRK